MNKLKTFQSYISPVLLGGLVLSFLSAMQKMSLGYPLYPISFVIPFTAGSICGFLYHMRWIIEEKHRIKTEHYNKRLETILETVQSGIIIIDTRTAIIESINSTAQKIYGYSNTEIVGKKCYDYLCDCNPESCSILNQDIEQDILEQAEIKTTDLNIPIIRKAKKMAFDDHMHIIVSVMDISPIVETEEKLREANERVRIADRLKSEFLTNVGHEIRTPLNAIIGISELLMSQDFNDEICDDLQLIKSSGKSLLKTMENIIDYAMLKSGSYQLQNHAFDLYQTILFASEIFQSKALQKGLNFDIAIDNCKNKQCIGDQSVLNKVLSNLLDNAIKFTSSGSITLKTDFTTEPSMIEIQISDTGIGIPEQKQEFIYDAFYQVNGSMTREYEGTGMGLALVDFFVQKMNGSIVIESSKNIGSTFHVYLPV